MLNDGDLKLIGLIINEPGMKLIECEIWHKLEGTNNALRISGNVFEDGRLKGTVEGMMTVVDMIKSLRKEVAAHKED